MTSFRENRGGGGVQTISPSIEGGEGRNKTTFAFFGGGEGVEGTHCYTTHDKSQNMLLGSIPFVPRLILGHIPPRQLREWRGREKFARQSRFFLLLHYFHFPIFALFPPSEFPFVFPPALQTFGGRGGEEDDGANCGKVGIAYGAGK